MACPLSTLLSWPFYFVRALSVNTTRRSCRACPVQPTAHIAVYSHSICTAGTVLRSCGSLRCLHRRREYQPPLRNRIRTATHNTSLGSGLRSCYFYKRLLSYRWWLIRSLFVICHAPVFLLAMEIVLENEYLTGTQNETVIKEMFIAGENVLETFQFPSPYAVRSHGDTEIGLNLEDGHIPTNNCSRS